jgi:hypothetical protein
MIYRIASWAGIAIGVAGVIAAYTERWPVALGLGLLAAVCAGLGLCGPRE